VLQNAKRLQWTFILRGDESWFFYVNENEKLWLVPDSDPPEVARRRINTAKVMVTLFWNTSGSHVSNFLAGESFDEDDFVRDVFTPIHLREWPRETQRSLICTLHLLRPAVSQIRCIKFTHKLRKSI
jgi:hypothetical protein